MKNPQNEDEAAGLRQRVQAAYQNEDSNLIVPITTDYLRAMKVIGQNIDVDIITHSKNTLFF